MLRFDELTLKAQKTALETELDLWRDDFASDCSEVDPDASEDRCEMYRGLADFIRMNGFRYDAEGSWQTCTGSRDEEPPVTSRVVLVESDWNGYQVILTDSTPDAIRAALSAWEQAWDAGEEAPAPEIGEILEESENSYSGTFSGERYHVNA